MATLHIEHPVTGFATWSEAFAALPTPANRAASAAPASSSRSTTRPTSSSTWTSTPSGSGEVPRLPPGNVWPSSQNAPALAGTPQTRILQPAPSR